MNKIYLAFVLMLVLSTIQKLPAQRGYFDAPYKHYEADSAVLSNGAIVTPKSYSQTELQSEASHQICVEMDSTDATIEFNFTEAADGLVIRYSVPDNDSATIGVYDGDTKITSILLTSHWSWESLWNNGDPNNVGITNKNPRMRFDEVRYKLPNKVLKLKLVKESGEPNIDFIEMEPVPEAIAAPENAAVFSGDGSSLQAYIDANGGKTIFVPAGTYNINSQLYFGVANTKLQGAGMWYTQLNFTVKNESNGGLRANAKQISYSDLYLTSEMTTRTNGYASVLGVYTPGSVIKNIWAEHFATGAWIAQYIQSGPAFADGFLMTGCRFRNTYADGINLCKGTRNAIVEHCSFRNNGDDAMAIWCAEGLECINNTFRFNTVENGWRAAGAALYGGKDNKFYNLLIKDNIDVGITITNTFPGAGFNDKGLHDFHDITLVGCGTFNATYNDRVGAINMYHANSAGTKVQNIRMYNIDIFDSKCDAIRISKSAGEGIINLIFENVHVNVTGTEYPDNNIANSTTERGYAVFFDNYPLGGATYCGFDYSNLGGNANSVSFSTTQKGTFKWTEKTGCETTAITGINLAPTDTFIAGGSTLQLLPIFSPSNATNKMVSYSSNNTNVATVDYAGLVTAISKGLATIYVNTYDGNYSAFTNVNVTSTPLTCYKIRNLWQNTYLYDADDRVGYNAKATGNVYLWLLEDANGKKEIKNFLTGDYMHIENLLSYVQCTALEPGKISSKWELEDAGGGFFRIKSDWMPTNYVHIENLQKHAQYGPVETSWWSAMWALEPVYIITSVNKITSINNTKIYPNPNTGEFYFRLNNFTLNQKIEIDIFNQSGQLVYQDFRVVDQISNMNIRVNANLLTPGIYTAVAKDSKMIERANLVICK